MRTLILYSRPECHLCERFMAELEPLLAGRATVRIVDVDESVATERKYGLRIPVLLDGDVEVSEYPLDRERVERHLSEHA
jgi:hypothetical protein